MTGEGLQDGGEVTTQEHAELIREGLFAQKEAYVEIEVAVLVV